MDIRFVITPPRHSHARRQSPAMSQFLRQLGALKVKDYVDIVMKFELGA